MSSPFARGCVDWHTYPAHAPTERPRSRSRPARFGLGPTTWTTTELVERAAAARFELLGNASHGTGESYAERAARLTRAYDQVMAGPSTNPEDDR